jgi:hypothetical protein
MAKTSRQATNVKMAKHGASRRKLAASGNQQRRVASGSVTVMARQQTVDNAVWRRVKQRQQT